MCRFCLLLLLIISSCTSLSRNDEDDKSLTVSAASDLIPAFEEIGIVFFEETGIAVTFNFGSSGQLTQQIEQGAPVDVFASANQLYVDELVQSNRILLDSVTPYALGRITIWTQLDSSLDIVELSGLTTLSIERIAIANPSHAPYGIAARKALESAGVWDQVQDRVVYGNNVSQTLQLAETHNVDVAIVALSLSMSSEGRWVLISDDLHNPIEQVLGIVRSTENESEARQFIAFVLSDVGTQILEKFGFVIPEINV